MLLCAFQWALFSQLLYHQQHHESTKLETCQVMKSDGESDPSMVHPKRPPAVTNDDNHNKKFDGIAATVLLRAPKWFHRRYPVMIQNMLSNIPETWGVQIFLNEEWFLRDVRPHHPFLLFQQKNPRIVVTPLPSELTKLKPKQIMKSEWLWSSMVVENVFMFSGNGVVCANRKPAGLQISNFTEFSFVGTPSHKFGRRGGDGGTYSFRHRSAMLRVLQEHPVSESEQQETDTFYFLKHMTASGSTFAVAPPQVTELFGHVPNDGSSVPMVVSGTLAHLSYEARSNVLDICPELKVIFPSLHEPTCFGAASKLNPAKCRSTICALRDEVPGHGC